MKTIKLLFILFALSFTAKSQLCNLTVLSTTPATPGYCDGRATILKNSCPSTICTYTWIPNAIFSFSGDTVFIDSLCAGSLNFAIACDTIVASALLRIGTVGIHELVANIEALSVYPNPAHHKVTVSFNASAKTKNLTTLHLCDVAGRIVLEKAISAVSGENKIEMDVSGVAKGVYFLNIAGHTAAENFESGVVKVVIE